MKRVKNKTVQKQCLAMVICLALCLSMLSPITYSVAATAATESEPAKQTISLDGVQMRGAMNGWYYYLVLKSDAYSTLSTNVEVIENAPELSSMDKIRLYTSAEDTTGTALSELTVQHIGRNIWGENGAFINFAEYDTTHGGHQVYKIVIEEGCELLADTDTIYVVDKTYTYINNSYGDESKKLSAFEWTLEETPEISKTEISVDGVQMRGAMNGWYYYLVLKSDAYSTLSTNVEVIENAPELSSMDKIRLYTSAEDTTGTALSDLTVQHIGRNIWGENGVFINFAEYDTTYGGHQVYKVVIEEGCELLADTDTIYVVDKTYTYINNSYGDESKKLSAFEWTLEETPEISKTEISVDGVQMRGAMNGWYYYLVLKSDAYSTLSANVETIENAITSSTLDKIRLYTSAEDTTGVALSDLTVQHIGRNIWGENGAFINFAEYDTTYGSHQVYKIVIEEGCELLADTDTIYVVDQTYTYYNGDYGDESKKLEAFNWTTEAPSTITKTEISLSGVQMRGAINGWYYYLVLQSDAYSTLSANVETIENAITLSTLDKIRLYTSAEDTTGTALSDLTVQHIGRNIWGENGAFINFAEHDTTYGGHQVYKIVIEEGCELLADTDTIYVVDQTYTYYNGDYGDESKKLEAFNWTTDDGNNDDDDQGDDNQEEQVQKRTISLNGVQMRGAMNGWYYYLVLKSDAFSTLSANVETIENAITSSTLDKIRLYTSTEDTTGTALSELTVQHIGRNIWGENGTFINFAEYDTTYGGHQVYKVVIEEGCELLADTNMIYVVDKTYTYYNRNYGDESKKLEAFSWSTEKAPEIKKTVISLNGLQMRGAENGWYYYLVLQSNAYRALSANVEVIENAPRLSTLNKIRLYTSAEDTTGTPLSKLTVQHIGRNIWGENGAFINFAEYDTNYGGHQVYKVVIEKGCELLADEGTVFVVDKTYTFINGDYGNEGKKLSAFNWTSKDVVSPESLLPVKYENISVDGVQLRGLSDNSWYQYLVVLSNAYQGFDTEETIAAWEKYFTADKIKLYKKDQNGKEIAVSLSELTIQHVGKNIWGANGAFINILEYANGYDGTVVYKVVIEEGCMLPVGQTDGQMLVYVVDNEYTFYNNSYSDESKKFENFDWSVHEIPQEVENTGNIKITTVTNQCGDYRYLILRLENKFAEKMNVAFFDTKGFSNVLDHILLYSGNDFSAEPIKLRDVWTGEINLGQYGSLTDIGFSIENEERLNGTNLYAVRILEGCEIPYMENGIFSKKTVEETLTFMNLYYGLSGDIPGEYDSQYQTPRKYENFAVVWSRAAFVEYAVEGMQGVSYASGLQMVDSKIGFSEFMQEGFDLKVTDNLGNTYYKEIVVPDRDVVITLHYSVKTNASAENGNGSNMTVVLIGIGVLGIALITGITVFVHKKKKKSAK